MRRTQKIKKERGITLIALIITIVVLLILAIVTINAVQDRSIIQHAQNATNEYNKGKDKEKNELGKYLAYLDRNVPGKEPISKTESYVGCYADVDGNGSVDGIIYADLSKGVDYKGTGTWGGTTYSTSMENERKEETNLNDYYVIKKEHEDENIKIGKKPVIAPLDKDKAKARFYVMSLSNFTTPEYTTFYWYKNASGKMNASDTSTAFGAGDTNTTKMIEIWNKNGGEGGYTEATQDNRDIWKHIQTTELKDWYIPSKDEWAAFGGELGITTDNYDEDYGLSNYYWSSSQRNAGSAWGANFNYGYMHNSRVSSDTYVRLGTTF